jgi:hypothetical protein
MLMPRKIEENLFYFTMNTSSLRVSQYQQNEKANIYFFFAYIAAEAYGKYRITKAKSMVVLTVLGAIASILTLDRYVTNILCIGA